MNRAGRETLRLRRATPPPLSRNLATQAITAALVAAFVGCTIVAARTASARAAAFAFASVALLAASFVHWCRKIALLLRVRRQWTPQGVRCLVVYSDSSVWQDRVTQDWLARLGPAALPLDRSAPRSSGTPLARAVFECFCLASSDHSPSIVVFRGLREPLVFRFYHAFQEARHGDARFLEAQERAAFAGLGLGDGGRDASIVPRALPA